MTTPAAGTTTSAATDTQAVVVASADAADRFGTAPTLLLELTEGLGRLAADAARLTDRGRRPFRPDDAWTHALGDLGYRLYLLADQTGVPLDPAVRTVAGDVLRQARHAPVVADDDAWPLRD